MYVYVYRAVTTSVTQQRSTSIWNYYLDSIFFTACISRSIYSIQQVEIYKGLGLISTELILFLLKNWSVLEEHVCMQTCHIFPYLSMQMSFSFIKMTEYISFSWSSSTISVLKNNETKSLLINYDYILLFGYHNWILKRYISFFFFFNNIGCIYAEQMQYFLDVWGCDPVACLFFFFLLTWKLLKEKSCKYI